MSCSSKNAPMASIAVRSAAPSGTRKRRRRPAERHRLQWVLPCQRKARPVAGNELLLFAVIAAVPHRADGVNDIFAGQAVSPRELGLAGPGTRRVAGIQLAAPARPPGGCSRPRRLRRAKTRWLH